MTKGLENMLGLPAMDEVIGEEDITEIEEENFNEEFSKVLTTVEHQNEMVVGKDHSDSMDIIYKETLKHAQDVMDLGFNIDPAKSARMFEVATGLYAKAIDAKNSKRDAQLKAMKLAIEQKRLELQEKQINHNIGTEGGEIGDGIVVSGNRNDVLKEIREGIKK